MPTTTIACQHSREVDYNGSYLLQTEDYVNAQVGTDTSAVHSGGVWIYPQYRTYLDFDVSSIAVGSIINSAKITLYVNVASTVNTTVYSMNQSPVEHGVSTASTLFNQITGNNYQSLSNLMSTGSVDFNLGGTALTDLSAAIGSSGKIFSVGLTTTNNAQDSIGIAGQSDGSNYPRLVVTYSTPSVINLAFTETLSITDVTSIALALNFIEIIRKRFA